jgi:hypothetical protein
MDSPFQSIVNWPAIRGDGDREAKLGFWAPALATVVDPRAIPVATNGANRVRV